VLRIKWDMRKVSERPSASFTAAPVSLEQVGRRNAEAVQLMVQAGWQ
jgi:hypothetical protein